MLAHITPVFLIIAIGALIRRLPGAPPSLFQALEWFTFYVAFPALLFLRTAQLEIDAATIHQLTLLVLLPTSVMVGLTLIALRFAPHLPGPARSSVVQGTTRPSTYYALAVAGLAFTGEIATLVMLALAIALPFINVVAVVALSWWSGNQVTAWSIFRSLVRNPIILGTVAGALYNVTGLPLPGPIAGTLEILGNVSLGLGLLCVGGGLVFQLQGSRPLVVAATNTAKLLLLPLITFVLCTALGVETAITVAACFYAGLPAAPNAYIMARQMGGDARLMASMITTQTLLSVLTVPLLLSLLGVAAPT